MRLGIRPEVRIVADIEVQETVAIHIRPPGGRSPGLRLQAERGRDIMESLAIILQQEGGSIAADINIRLAIVIEIPDRAPQIIAGKLIQPGFFRNVRKISFAIAFVQHQFCGNGVTLAIGNPAADKENIQESVAVIIQESAAIPDSLKDIERAFSRRGPLIVQARLLPPFPQSGARRWRPWWQRVKRPRRE